MNGERRDREGNKKGVSKTNIRFKRSVENERMGRSEREKARGME